MSDSRSQAFFIDEGRQVFKGEEAISRVQAKNESRWVDPERGIVRVDHSRWEEAQRYERRTWLIDGRSAVEDRNEYHKEHFANYAAIRGFEFECGIELGCGPFTNMRLILSCCRVAHVYLLDPLINDYLRHPFCAYKNGRLEGMLNPMLIWRDVRQPHPVRFLRNRLSAYHAGGLFGQPVHMIACAIESFRTDLRFDLIVMTNVLEHCQDAERVLNKILELLSPGGICIFSEVLYEAKEVLRLSAVSYDAGHPLRVDRSIINRFLGEHFIPLMHAEYLRDHDFCGVRLRNYELYFIGKR